MSQQQQSPAPTFTHTNENSTLQGVLNLQTLTLSLYLKYPSLHFPKVYQKTLQQSSLPTNIACIFGDIVSLYKVMKVNELIHVGDSSGNIKVKYNLIVGGEQKARQMDIQLERNLENELEQMRLIVGKESEKLGKIEELQNRIDRLWQREQETQKIFLKFKQQIQSKTEEISQRQKIQTTKMSIIQQDLHKLTISFNKLSMILCPIFPHLNVQSEYTSQFIIQDRKIVYVGEQGRWTQILFNSDIMEKKQVEFSYKIVCAKKGNVVAGITLSSQSNARSSLSNGKGEKEKKYIAVNGFGQILTHKQITETSDNCLMVPQNQQQCIDNEKEHKSSHEITLPSPVTTFLTRSPSVSSKSQSEIFKPMQVIKMCVDLQRNKITWKNGNKSLLEAKIWQQYKNESIVPYFQFCDTGDAVEWIQG